MRIEAKTIRAAKRFYKARYNAEKYYHNNKDRIAYLSNRSPNSREFTKLSDRYHNLKLKEYGAWDIYWLLIYEHPDEYEAVIKSIIRHKSYPVRKRQRHSRDSRRKQPTR